MVGCSSTFARLRWVLGTIALSLCVAWVASLGQPWCLGIQREPRWACAVGSGRVKLWWAKDGAFMTGDTWTSSWYRGLDGSAVRWGVDASFGVVRVVAIPLWPFFTVAASGAFVLPRIGKKSGSCSSCGYDRNGLHDPVPCPECGMGVQEAVRKTTVDA